MPFLIWANMASPIEEGTLMASPFISQQVHITKEKIFIIPDKRFETAQFKIEYHITAEQSGTQIPLLFYAMEYKDDFKIWLDDQEIQLRDIPESYTNLEGSSFADFSYLFTDSLWSNMNPSLLLDESSSSGFYLTIDDLKFFEADLAKGDHIIKVAYRANQWIDHMDWVKAYSFRYVLSPAKHWKSFDILELILDTSNFEGEWSTNLEDKGQADAASRRSWTFSELPVDVLEITYEPKISSFAKTLIAISPEGLSMFVAIILVMLHFLAMRYYRKLHWDKRFSWAMILGSILVPLLFLLSYPYAFTLIDGVIGAEASGRHGYVILILMLYPIILPIYWTLMWLVDRFISKKISKHTSLVQAKS